MPQGPFEPNPHGLRWEARRVTSRRGLKISHLFVDANVDIGSLPHHTLGHEHKNAAVLQSCKARSGGTCSECYRQPSSAPV